MIHCSTNQLRDYQFGLLDEAASARISAHLETCEECRAGLERIRQQFAALDMLGEPPPISEDLLNRVSDLEQRQQTRRAVAGKQERRQVMFVGKTVWKAAAALAILIGTGAIATTVGLKIYRHHFEGKDREGKYWFSSEPEVIYATPTDSGSSTESTVVVQYSAMTDDSTNGIVNPSEAEKVEQMQQELEEIDQLRQRDKRELTHVRDRWINGHFHRTCTFSYILADGRVHNVNEGDPELEKQTTPEQIKRDMAEVTHLREQGPPELVRIFEDDIEGNIFRVYIYEYTLSDGRTVPVGGDDPDPDLQTLVLSPEQIREVWRLYLLKQGEYLGDSEREINGHIFTCAVYIFTLSDGTVVTHTVGERKNRKSFLTDAEKAEFESLREPETGELLDITEREVHGHMFRFERRRYTLSNGVEVIQSDGKPLDSQ